MSDEEREKKAAELRQERDKIKASLIEIEEGIREEERQQKERTIRFTNEEVAKVKENEKQIFKYFNEWAELDKKIDKWEKDGKPLDPKLKSEYIDLLVRFSNMIENFPIYDNASYKSEEAIKRFLMKTAIDSYDPRDPMWSEYLAEYLKKMGLQHLFVYRCKRCDHMWLPRGYNPVGNILLKKPPKSCARCKSKYWNLEPKRKTKHVVDDAGVLKHDKLTRTQIITMVKNVNKFLKLFVNTILPEIEKIEAEKNETEKQEEQPMIVVTSKKKKKPAS
jgi:hypothetical protein